MSYPSDGEPRFVVASIKGGDVHGSPYGQKGSLEHCVHDRAVAHRVVRTFSQGAYDWHGEKYVTAHRLATEECAVLNTEAALLREDAQATRERERC